VFGCADTSALNQDELEYFSEIAFGAEFGDVDPRILKWNEDVRIRIIGNFTEADWTSVESVVRDLNGLIETLNLKIVDKNQNVSMYFTPESTFAEIEPNYVPTNYGFFWTNWYDDNFELYSATILIASDYINQEERSHLIREELTQCLGLMNDSEIYSNSMFFQGWTKTQDFSSLDKRLIRALYRPDIKSGMTRTEALTLLTAN
jgi:hypothetical protein